MESRIVKATKWAFITEILAKLITPLTNIILAHILAPSAFGVLATVLMVVSFAEMLADAGFEKYMVQHEFHDEESKKKAINVAFVANMVFALFLWCVIVLFRNELAILVGNPGLGIVMAVMGFSLPLTAFTSVQLAMYRREFDFKFVMKTRMVTVLTPLIVAVPLAMLGSDYWALIIGILASKVFLSVLLVVYGNVKVKWEFDYNVFKNMLSFSSWSILEAFSIWLTAWIDMFLVGSFLNEYYLGLYRMPVAMVNAAMAIITNSILPVLFAALSRVQNDDEKFKEIFFKFQRYVAMCICPIGVLIFVFRNMGIQILLGKQWSEGAIVLGLWALSNSVVIVISYLESEVFRAKGLPRISFLSQILHLIVLVPVVYYYVQDSFEHFIYARSIVRLEGILVGVILLKYVLGFSVFKLFSNICRYLLISVILLLILEPLVEFNKSIGIQLLLLLLGIILYFFMLYCFKEDRAIICGLWNKIRSKQIGIKMKSDNSLSIVSFVKLVMMLFVVLYHSSIIYMIPAWGPTPPIYNNDYIKYFAQWLNTMHIYTFTAMAGYIFYYLTYEVKRYNSFKIIVKKKCARLLKPYILASCLWAIPFYIYFFHPDVIEVLKKFVLGYAPSQLWFLLMLFWVFFVFGLLVKYVDFSSISSVKWFIIFVLIYYLTSGFNLLHVPNILQFQTGLRYLLFFYIGIILRRYMVAPKFGIGLIALVVSIGLLTIENHMHSKYITLLSYPVLCLASVIAAYMIIGWLSRFINLDSNLLKKFEASLMTIYLVHQQIIYICIELFNRPIFNPYEMVLLTFLVAIISSYAIYLIINRVVMIMGKRV